MAALDACSSRWCHSLVTALTQNARSRSPPTPSASPVSGVRAVRRHLRTTRPSISQIMCGLGNHILCIFYVRTRRDAYSLEQRPPRALCPFRGQMRCAMIQAAFTVSRRLFPEWDEQ